MIKCRDNSRNHQLTDKNNIAKAVHNYVNENRDYLWKRVNYILLKRVLVEWE